MSLANNCSLDLMARKLYIHCGKLTLEKHSQRMDWSGLYCHKKASLDGYTALVRDVPIKSALTRKFSAAIWTGWLARGTGFFPLMSK